MRTTMPTETITAAAVAAAKTIGAKASLGIVGAALLYLLTPPERPDGTFSKVEFVSRLAVAGFFSAVLGDWFVSVVDGLAPFLKAAQHPAPFWLAIGAPGWWVSRAAALWLHKRRAKDIGELASEVRDAMGPRQ